VTITKSAPNFRDPIDWGRLVLFGRFPKCRRNCHRLATQSSWRVESETPLPFMQSLWDARKCVAGQQDLLGENCLSRSWYTGQGGRQNLPGQGGGNAARGKLLVDWREFFWLRRPTALLAARNSSDAIERSSRSGLADQPFQDQSRYH